MASQPSAGERALPSRALDEPTAHVRWGWITGLSLASLGMWMASLTPVQILLALQLQDITTHKVAALGIVTGLGAVAACVATPLAGALSDRTTAARGLGRLRGRRHRWTIAMAVLGAGCLVILGGLATVAGVAVLWVAFSAFQNAEFASLSAAIPDHVPVRQRATVAGWVGMPQALGLVLGTVLVVDIFDKTLLQGYVALAILLVVLTLPFVLMTPDHPLEAAHRAPFSWRAMIRSYWISPREHPDFGWAWLTRFLASLAIAMGTLYLLYFLEGPVRYRQHFHRPATDGLQTLIIIYTACVVLTAIGGGVVSDRIGKRKMIVTVSGILMGLAAALLTFAETWDAALVAAALFGVGFGAYLAVDQALITQVLPAASDRAKDLGIINIAIVAPSAIGPAIAAPITAVLGYPALFGATAIVAALGCVLVWRIRGVP
jgi:MFS family permease